MRKVMLPVFALGLAVACRPQQPTLPEAERAAIADTVKRILISLRDAASRRDAAGFVSVYAADSDMKPAHTGQIYPTLESFHALADSFYQSIAGLDPKLGEIRTMVLSPDAAAAQVPVAFTITTKAGKQLAGQGVYTAVLQKRGDAWKIVQSHESWVHFDRLLEEIFPTPH